MYEQAPSLYPKAINFLGKGSVGICLFALMACNNAASKPSSNAVISGTTLASESIPIAFGEIRVRFVPGRDREIITVSTLDRAAIKSAILVIPGGNQIAASTIDTEQDPAVSGNATSAALAYRPSYTLATPGGPQPFQGMPQTTTSAIGQTLSTAQIYVPDMGEYAKYWSKARIKIVEGEGAAQQPLTLSAPPPV